MTGNRKLEMFFWTQNIRALYKPGADLDLAREIEKYKMKCVALHELIKWEDVY